MTTATRAASAAVRVLEAFGVRYAFTVPGESFLGLLDALRDSSIQVVTTRHEGGAAFMAEAVGKLTGVPALCMGTRAVGAANLAIGLHTAQQDSTPLVAVVGQVDTAFRHREAFQETELASFLGHVTKWAVEVPTGDRLAELVGEALRRSVSGRPGPVALSVPADILDEPVPDRPVRVSPRPIGAPRQRDVEAALELLRRAKRPVIIAGGGVLHSGATGDLVTLAERLSIPVLTAFRRHDAFPNDHPLYLGSLSLGAPRVVVERAREADVVLALGTRFSEITTFGYSLPSSGAQVIQVDASPDVIGHTVPVALGIVADVRETIVALTRAASGFPDRTPENVADRAAFERATTPPLEATVDEGVDPALVVSALQRTLPADAVVTSDAGNFYGWLSRYYRFRRPRTYLGPTSGAMGYAVPAAVAAALVHANAVPVVALAGDGGFLMTGNELAVAAHLGLDVTCIVFNNALYGTIHMHQERAYPGRSFATELWSPDFVRIAEAFGGYGVRIDDCRDVEDAVRAVVEHRGISLLEVIVPRALLSVEQSVRNVGTVQS